MNASERLGLIRAKSAPGQKAAEAVKPVVKRKPGLIVRGSGRPTCYAAGLVCVPRYTPEWISEADAKAEWRPRVCLQNQ